MHFRMQIEQAFISASVWKFNAPPITRSVVMPTQEASQRPQRLRFLACFQ